MNIVVVSLKLMLLALLLSVAGGCTHRAMNSAVASWKDQPVADVIAAWGQPSEELKVSGKHLYVWNNFNGTLLSPETKRPPVLPDTHYCTRLLEVDKSGTVISGNWDGTDCPGFFSGWAR